MNEKRKIKVLYWVDTFFGGGEKSVKQLVDNLDKIRFEPSFVSYDEGVFVDHLRESGYTVVTIPLNTFTYKVKRTAIPVNPVSWIRIFFNFLFPARKLADYIKNNSIDILHANDIKSMIIASFAKFFCSFKLIMHYRGTIRQRIVNLLVLFFADKVINNSNAVRQGNYGTRKSDKIEMIYNGINFDNLKIEKNREETVNSLGISGLAKDNVVLLGCIGYFFRWKNYEFLIESARILNEKYSDWLVLIIGDTAIGDEGYFNELKEKVNEYNLENKIIFTGQRDDIFDVINMMDILISPSVFEPLGRSIIESMAFAKPVIGTDSGGTPEMIDDGKSGYLVPLNSPEILSDRIYDLSVNKDKRERFARVSKEKCRQLFDIRTHVDKVSKIYEELIGS